MIISINVFDQKAFMDMNLRHHANLEKVLQYFSANVSDFEACLKANPFFAHLRNSKLQTPLHILAGTINGDVNLLMVNALIAAGADVNALDIKDSTPTHDAIIADNKLIAKRLLDKSGVFILNKQIQDKISTNHQDELYVALKAIIDKNQEKIETAKMSDPKRIIEIAYVDSESTHDRLEHMLDLGADPNYWSTEFGENVTALHAVSTWKMTPRLRTVELLLSRDAKPGFSLHQILSSPNSKFDEIFELVELLLRHEADINARDAALRSPLYVASGLHQKPELRFRLMKLLLEHGADPNYNPSKIHCYTHPLHIVASYHPLDVASFKLLIEHGANPLLRDRNGRSVIEILIILRSDNLELIRYLFDTLNAEIKAETATIVLSYMCVTFDDIDCPNEGQLIIIKNLVKMLLKYGANPNGRQDSTDYDNPITNIISSFNLNIQIKCKLTRMLLRHGADPELIESESIAELKKTRSDVLNSGRVELLKMLITYGRMFDVVTDITDDIWNLSDGISALIDIVLQIKAQGIMYERVHRQIIKSHNQIMWHPDRIRTRIQLIQTKLTLETYNYWLENESGWLEYFGIYDYDSFVTKMRHECLK